MGTMIYGMAQSLDGYVAGATGDITVPAPGEALHRHFNERQRETAVALYGRRMYGIMRYWETADTLPESEPWEVEFAKLWQATPKVVVSTTLKTLGPNARLIGTGIDDELKRLKAETTGIIDVAGPTLAATCSRLGLIDEYRLYVHPVVLGGGKPYFAEGFRQVLRHAGTEELTQGVTMMRYRPDQ